MKKILQLLPRINYNQKNKKLYGINLIKYQKKKKFNC